MKTVVLVSLAALAFAVPASQAHYGDIWFTTAAKAAGNIEDKYDVQAARCWKFERASDRVRYTAHSTRTNNSILWDHFLCGLYTRSANVCFVVAHITGREWHNIVLTTYHTQGCTPYQFRRRG